MKPVSRVVACSVISALMLGGVAYAADTGSITNTGPGSNNTITINNSCASTTINSNNIDITNSNHQSSGSGGITSTGNTSSGSISSGSSSNTNSFGVDLTINNSTAPDCSPQAVATPTSGGQVSGVSTTATIEAASVTQVDAPVGGVGAGKGGISSSIFAASIFSGALGIYRLRKSNLQKI